MSASKNKNFLLVSVIVRTKDRAELLREALESLATQSYPYIEAVVVNDGGVDVWPIVEEFADRLYRIKYIAHEKNRGRAAAANTGLHAAEGEWVGLLDDDDLLLPKAVETLIWHGKAASAVYGQVEIVCPQPDGPGEIIAVVGQPFSRESLFVNNYIPTCGFIFKRHLALKIGGFDEKFSLLEDWDFIYRLAQETDFLFIPQKVALYRIFGRGFIADRDFRKEAPWRERFYRKHLSKVDATFLAKGYFDFVENQEKALFILQQKLFEDLKQERERFVQEFEVERQKLLEEFNQEREKLLEERQKLLEEFSQERNRLEQEKEKLAQALQKESLEKERLAQELKALFSSESWRITAPLRWLGFKARRAKAFSERYAILVRKFWSYTRTFGLRAALEKTRVWLSSRKALPVAPYYPALSPSQAEQLLKNLSYKPLISVIVPVYNTPEPFLRACLESVFNQYYPHWELCIADDASTEPHVRSVLEEFRQRAPDKIKIIYRDTNGHISEATNSALSLATGEFVAFLDHDDELSHDALLEVAKLLNRHPDADLIYSDEDKIDETGTHKLPFYKPDWSPDLLECQNYICHLTVVRKKILEQVGLLRKGFEGAQDYDLILRITDFTNKIYHIPKILYSWREIPSSTAINQEAKPYARVNGQRALQEHIRRKLSSYSHLQIKVIDLGDLRYETVYLPKSEITISIIIPTKDKANLLKNCINSIIQKTTYKNFEIIIMDNNSHEEETFLYFRELKKYKNIKIVKANYPFNWSKINNHGIEEAKGEIYIFLNNDTEIITKNWLEKLAGDALRPEIGVVGPLLLYKNGLIQHAGVVVGLGGWADELFKGFKPVHQASPFVSPLVKRNVLAVTGACMAIAKKTIEKIGKFNENFIVCGGDVEICIRAYENGFYNVYNPFVKLYHHESQTRDTKKIPKSDFEMSYKVYKKYLENGDPFYNINLSLENSIPMVRNHAEKI